MGRYEEGLKLIEGCCGNGKDNVIALATVSVELGDDGKACPCVRDVDAYYEDGVFYVTTWGKSNKVKQIENNRNVGFVVSHEGISGVGIGENLGWVLKPENADIRAKLREAFSDWYDDANDEQDPKCVVLAIRVSVAKVFRDHGAVRFEVDFSRGEVR